MYKNNKITKTLKYLAAGCAASCFSAHATDMTSLATVTTTSAQQSAEHALDGNNLTRWESVHADEIVELTVDLKQSLDLNSITIGWESANASNYQVLGSNDNFNWQLLNSHTGGTFGARSDTLDIAGKFQFLKLVMLEKSAGNQWGYSIYELSIDANHDVIPVTEGISVSASSELQNAQNAIDGELSTRWESLHSDDTAELILDLQDNQDLYSLNINWEAANASEYQVLGSNDNTTWSLIESISGGQFGLRSDEVPLAGNYRYIKISMLNKSEGNDWGYSINDIAVSALSSNKEIGQWALVWNDEFDGSSIDMTKWEHEVNCTGGGNNEQQCYTSSSENSFVDDGKLKIVAKPNTDPSLNKPYTSARLRTKYKGDWTYGRVEIKAKPPKGQGSFPAIWMLPTDKVYGGWPHSGEIDIFESVNLKEVDANGNVESGIHGNLWYGRSWPNQTNTGAHYELPNHQNPADDFHVYAVEWEAGEIRWYVDDVLYQTQLQSEVIYDEDGDGVGLAHKGWFTDHDGEFLWDTAPYDQDFHVILNFAVGGNWAEHVNNGGIDASAFNESNAFEFDYVRVYECSADPLTGKGCATTHEGYLDPIDQGGTLVEGAAPPPVKPSDGVIRELTVFADDFHENWPAWNCCDSASPKIVQDDEEHGAVVEFSIGQTPTVVGFNTNNAAQPARYDASPMTENGLLEFDLKLVSEPINPNVAWNLKVEQADASSSATIRIVAPTTEWRTYSIPLKTLNNAGLNANGIDVFMLFPEWGKGEGAVFRVDNFKVVEGEPVPQVGEELISNGGFDTNLDGWVSTSGGIVQDGEDSVYKIDVSTAGNTWDQNLSQELSIIPDTTYEVTFRAKASESLDILAGLGLNQQPYTNASESVSLTTEWQTFTLLITTRGFGDNNSRVLFDLGASSGSVYLDDISVSISDAGNVVEGQFNIIAEDGSTDVNFNPETIGEWSTGTQMQANVSYENLLAWQLTSSTLSAEEGNWGTVLAFQNGFDSDLSSFNRIELKLATAGDYNEYKMHITANGVSEEITLPVNKNINGWQTISINTSDIALNLSAIESVAIFAKGGTPGVSTLYISDFAIIKDDSVPMKDSPNSDYVFISSTPSVASDLIHDGNDNSDVGNAIFGEWSTDTIISSINYDGLEALQLSEAGGWGAVLAIQGDISDGVNIDNFDVDLTEYTNIKFKVASLGEFDRYALSIVSKVGDNEVSQDVEFTLQDPSVWNQIDIDLSKFGVDLSNINQMAVFGVLAGGESTGQQVYLTNMVAYDSGKLNIKDSSDDKFVFFSSTGEASDLVWDGDNTAHNGNITTSEWSTGTTLNGNTQYLGVDAFELTRAPNSWGAVLSFMGDIYGGVQEYKLDIAKYSTVNLSIAAEGSFSSYTINFIAEGASYSVPLTVGTDWTDVSINIAEMPINASKMKQIAIYGVGGEAGDKIYIADFNITK